MNFFWLFPHPPITFLMVRPLVSYTEVIWLVTSRNPTHEHHPTPRPEGMTFFRGLLEFLHKEFFHALVLTLFIWAELEKKNLFLSQAEKSKKFIYEYMENTAREREEARRKEERRLENERKLKERVEKLRIAMEKQEEEERRKAEYREKREREVAQEEARRREEEVKRLQLENELCLRRAELFDYKFGNKTRLDSFRGLAIDDVTQLRIGVFGPTGSGKSCFINTCERAVRETGKGSAPDSTTGQEGTITLQDYLPEMFFRLVDTRGFFNYNVNEVVEFQNILEGRIQPGDNVIRPKEDQVNTAPMELHPCPEFASKLHGIIIVVMANDPRLRKGALKDYLKPVRDILQKKGNVGVNVMVCFKPGE